ncbi:hypothetical protein Voc01_057210 [Virgisporangium ochraceum]|uniref:Uncharacterized protein n=2 Tax=Virgisporangium ochraceum TaxID=65505 RepID=A0A8J3ZUR2_9ACTN|nr:hypothetical protein Voc01_057210 [Virgisporangium ochraceum]
MPPLLAAAIHGPFAGGLAAIWIRERAAALDTQPVVFLGSEGEIAVLARNLADYLWLVGNGVGPLDAVDGLHRTPTPVPELNVPGEPRSTGAILAIAQLLRPELEEFVEQMCR